MFVKIYIMATHGKFLYKLSIKGIRNGDDLETGVYGLFNTDKVLWTYFIISYYTNNNRVLLTNDICNASYLIEITYDNIKKYGKPCNTVDEGKQYLEDFKMKWDSGSNNTTSEMRDKKIDEILN